jgi:hypothetical protein
MGQTSKASSPDLERQLLLFTGFGMERPIPFAGVATEKNLQGTCRGTSWAARSSARRDGRFRSSLVSFNARNREQVMFQGKALRSFARERDQAAGFEQESCSDSAMWVSFKA